VIYFEQRLIFVSENGLFGEKISTVLLLTKTGVEKGSRVADALLFL
jgi:hypothetical protein